MIYVSEQLKISDLEQRIAKELNLSINGFYQKAACDLSFHWKNEPEHILFLINNGRKGILGLSLAIRVTTKFSAKKVKILICVPKVVYEQKFSEVEQELYDLINKNSLEIHFIDENYEDLLVWTNCIVDCMYGFGELEVVPKTIMQLINKVNERKSFVLVLEAPTGSNVKSNEQKSAVIQATKTIMFLSYDSVFLDNNNFFCLGQVEIETFGLSCEQIKNILQTSIILDAMYVDEIKLFSRTWSMRKEDYGTALIFASNLEYINAGALVANMIINCGVNKVIWALPPDLVGKQTCLFPEVLQIDGADRSYLNEILTTDLDVITYGNGKSNSERTYNTLDYILNNSKKPIILDSNAIRIIDQAMLKKLKGHSILVLYLSEFAQLIKKPFDEVQKNQIRMLKEYAAKNKVIIVIKDLPMIITNGEMIYLNGSGNPEMLMNGIDEIITGAIASFVEKGYELLEASYFGTYLVGLTADQCAQNRRPVRPTNIIEHVSIVINELILKGRF